MVLTTWKVAGRWFSNDWENQEKWKGGWIAKSAANYSRAWATGRCVLGKYSLTRICRASATTTTRLITFTRTPYRAGKQTSADRACALAGIPASGWTKLPAGQTGKRLQAASSKNCAKDQNFENMRRRCAAGSKTPS
ncbi:hypothetical protein KCP78_07765 [Salmonella enterica subsp. enterica]|nr:hypothetical protein KCP78_07765 [Salmonella enterica subsp. enterica]